MLYPFLAPSFLLYPSLIFFLTLCIGSLILLFLAKAIAFFLCPYNCQDLIKLTLVVVILHPSSQTTLLSFLTKQLFYS